MQKYAKVRNKDASVPYHDLPEGEVWRVDVILELISGWHGDIVLPGLEKDEMEYIVNSLCTQ